MKTNILHKIYALFFSYSEKIINYILYLINDVFDYYDEYNNKKSDSTIDIENDAEKNFEKNFEKNTEKNTEKNEIKFISKIENKKVSSEESLGTWVDV